MIASLKFITVSLILLTSVALVYSQTDAPMEQAAPVAMVLPAENVELTDARGRTITATVLRKDANGIVIEMANGQEAHVAWNKLSAETQSAILGKVIHIAPKVEVKKAPQRMQSQVFERLRTEAGPAIKELDKLPVQEIHKQYLENTDLVKTATAAQRMSYENDAAVGLYKDPQWQQYNLSPFDIIKELKMPEPGVEEKFSLRPEFEKLGVTALKQHGETCSQYASYHLLQYLVLKDKATPPTFTKMLRGYEMVKGRLPQAPHLVCYDRLGEVTHRIYGKQAYKMEMDCGSYKLSVEIAKHHLRQGNPILARVRTEAATHLLVLVGFHTKANGHTTFEHLDSNKLYVDKGYGTTHNFIPGGSFAFWF